MYAQLGKIKFEGLKGIDALSGKEETSLAEHALVDGRPHLQKTGDKLTELQLGIRINSQFANPEAELKKIRTAKETGEVLTFITGKGASYGDFVIKGFEFTVEQTTPSGEMVSLAVTLTLVEFYDPDKLKRDQDAAKKAGFANIANMPSKDLSGIKMQGTAALAMRDVKTVKASATKTQELLQKAKTAGDSANAWMDKANKKVNEMKSALTDLQAKIYDATGLPDLSALIDRATGLKNNCSSLSGNLAVYDLQTATLTSNIMQTEIRELNTDAAQLANLVTLRQ